VSQPSDVSVPDLAGADYRDVLRWFHGHLQPSRYFEIGTLTGATLGLANCPSLAVDPMFQLDASGFLGRKSQCSLYQLTSDKFFASFDPSAILGGKIDLAFLDGMHRCEFLLRDFTNTEKYCHKNSVIIFHDCVPVETSIAERTPGLPTVRAHRNGMWAGDVWRVVLALQHYRPDLKIHVFDAAPTGLVAITNLNSRSEKLQTDYFDVVDSMLNLDLETIGISNYFKQINLLSTDNINTPEKMTKYFWL
jgi:hypothetical protein